MQLRTKHIKLPECIIQLTTNHESSLVFHITIKRFLDRFLVGYMLQCKYYVAVFYITIKSNHHSLDRFPVGYMLQCEYYITFFRIMEKKSPFPRSFPCRIYVTMWVLHYCLSHNEKNHSFLDRFHVEYMLQCEYYVTVFKIMIKSNHRFLDRFPVGHMLGYLKI